MDNKGFLTVREYYEDQRIREREILEKVNNLSMELNKFILLQEKSNENSEDILKEVRKLQDLINDFQLRVQSIEDNQRDNDMKFTNLGGRIDDLDGRVKVKNEGTIKLWLGGMSLFGVIVAAGLGFAEIFFK